MIGILCSLLLVLVYGFAGCSAVKYYGFLSLYKKMTAYLNFSGSIKYIDGEYKIY